MDTVVNTDNFTELPIVIAPEKLAAAAAKEPETVAPALAVSRPLALTVVADNA